MGTEISGGSGYPKGNVTWTTVQVTGSWDFARMEMENLIEVLRKFAQLFEDNHDEWTGEPIE